ncbi:MAG: Flp pilus assembly protein TadC [Sphingomonadales bacterium]|nr:Flp pilus assembly protein TadC [Sphingomonadales bacterium]
MSVFMTILYFLLVIAGLGLFARGLVMMSATERLDARIARGLTTETLANRRTATVPTFLAARGRDRDEIVQKLQLAGFHGEQAIERFLLLRLVATGATVVAMLVLSELFWGGFFAQPLVLFLIPACVYLGSKRALIITAKARERAITAEFPFLLDILLMMLESGISLDQCFRVIARDEAGTVPHLNRALVVLVQDLDRGMDYETALNRWAVRIAVPGAKDLAALFLQGLFQGVELSPALRQFVREFTERRIAVAREAMGKIAVKLVVVMILFFMPALFIVVGGPPVTSLFDTMKAMRQ